MTLDSFSFFALWMCWLDNIAGWRREFESVPGLVGTYLFVAWWGLCLRSECICMNVWWSCSSCLYCVWLIASNWSCDELLCLFNFMLVLGGCRCCKIIAVSQRLSDWRVMRAHDVQELNTPWHAWRVLIVYGRKWRLYDTHPIFR